MRNFRKHAVQLTLALIPLAAEAQELDALECGAFDLQAKMVGSEIEVSLQTDLPVNTSVMFGISRGYTQVSSAEKYAGDYHSHKTIAGSLRKPKRYTVDDRKWDRERMEKQKLMSRLGEPFTVKAVSSHVEVSVVVPINQSDPRFGKGNKNLFGCGVSTAGLRIIRREILLSVPYTGSMAGAQVASLNPRNLEAGRGYIIEKRIPLMPEHSPTDPMAGLRNMRYAQPGSVVRILDRRIVKGNVWYWVAAGSASAGRMGNHWVNSTAFVGQKLEALDR